MQETIFTRKGTDRIMRYAFELAMKPGRKKHVTSATKSNGIIHTMPYWDERFAAMGNGSRGALLRMRSGTACRSRSRLSRPLRLRRRSALIWD